MGAMRVSPKKQQNHKTIKPKKNIFFILKTIVFSLLFVA